MNRFILIFLLFLNLLHANEYPKFFSKLGTPLYKADKAFTQLSHLEGMKEKTAYYHSQAQHLLSVAKSVEADPKTKKQERKAYVKHLRHLQKEHDEILLVLNAILLKSIDEDDFATFCLIMNTDLDAILDNSVILKRSMAYYVANRTREKIDKLDKIFTSLNPQSHLYEYVQGHLPKVKIIEQIYNIDGPVRELSLSNNEKFAYLASSERCFKVLDINEFSTTGEVGSYEFSEQECRLLAVTLSKDSKSAYLSDLNNGFAIIDISVPDALVMMGEYPRIKVLFSLISKDDKTAFVVQRNRGLSILDISNKKAPRLLASYNHGLKVSSLAYDDNKSMLYVAHTKGLSLLDVSTLGNPREVLSYEVANGSSHVALSLKRGVAYLSALEEGVHVLDISNDNNVSHISTYQTLGSAHHLKLSDDESSLFISTMEDGVEHVDTKELKDLRHRVSYKVEKGASEEEFSAYSSTLNAAQDHLYISYGKLGIAKVNLKR